LCINNVLFCGYFLDTEAEACFFFRRDMMRCVYLWTMYHQNIKDKREKRRGKRRWTGPM